MTRSFVLIFVCLSLAACDVLPNASAPAPRPDGDEKTAIHERENRTKNTTQIDGFHAVHMPAERPQGVLVLLHGFGSNPEDIIEIGRMIRLDWEVWAPRAPIELGKNRYSWFDLEFGKDGKAKRGDEEKRMGEALDELERFVLNRARANRPLVVAGFSQGGAVAMILGTRKHETLAGVAALSAWLPETESSPYPNREYFVSHGSDDKRVSVEAGEDLAAKLNPQRTFFRIYPGMPHTVGRSVISDLRKWLEKDVAGRPEFN